MVMPPSVLVLANDVTPGSGLPVAAPGLRAHGLAVGLREQGFEVTTILSQRLMDELWAGATPPSTQPGTVILNGAALSDFIETHAPVTVVMTNSNQIEFLGPIQGVRYIFDFFAPKMLERAYQFGDEGAEELMRSLRQRKLRALELADGIAINGAKKVPYVLAWLLQLERDLRSVPTAVVNMAVNGVSHHGSGDDPLRLAVAGYLQGWSLPGPWMGVLRTAIEGSDRFALELLLPTHWGQHRDDLQSDEVSAMTSLENVTVHPTMRFSEFQDFMAGVDVAVDLFDWSLEREYAMVTRTVVALACGVPVIHPPFTEVAPFIDEYDAGWLVAASDLAGIEQLLATLDRAEAARKSANAVRLWNDVFRPSTAALPLVELIHRIWGES